MQCTKLTELQQTTKANLQHDKKANIITLLPGDRVLVKNFEKGGPGKIRSYWEQTVYRVVKQLNDDAPVYTVEPETGNGKQRTLHRTLLLPYDSLPIDNPKDIPLYTSRKNCQKQNIRQRQRRQPIKKDISDQPFASVDNSSEDEETLTFYPCDLEVKPSTSCTASNEADITTSVDTELFPESSDQQQYFDSPDNQEATQENVLPTEPVNDLSHTPTVDVLLDDCESSAQQSLTEDMNTSQQPQRTHKAPTQLAYTTPGKPVDC